MIINFPQFVLYGYTERGSRAAVPCSQGLSLGPGIILVVVTVTAGPMKPSFTSTFPDLQGPKACTSIRTTVLRSKTHELACGYLVWTVICPNPLPSPSYFSVLGREFENCVILFLDLSKPSSHVIGNYSSHVRSATVWCVTRLIIQAYSSFQAFKLFKLQGPCSQH
jgi:hypothetical protein